MMRYFALFLLLIISVDCNSQEDAWIYFIDKPNVSEALADPVSILTQKAIDRKENFNIAIDERDVPVNENYISDLKSQNGISVLAKSKWFNAAHVRGSEADINALLNLGYVERIDFANNNLDSTSREEIIADETNINDEYIEFTYGSSQNQVEMINVDNLHILDYTGEGITIAVMDSGFPNVNTMAAFQRLRDNGDLLNGYDFVNRTEDLYTNTLSSHGTRVLSDMAGYIQDQFVGTAPDASYHLFITEDAANENPVEESYWVEAAERADSLGVDIINTSLGYRVFDNSNYNYTPADMDGETTYITRGASIAADKGMLIVVSAGNAGATTWQTVGAPADSANVLSVGAVDANGSYVSFSSRGSDAQVGYQKPDVVARGGAALVINESNNIVQNNGTSFSAPILCGGIASLWQAIPDVSPTELMNFVRQSASQYSAPDDFLGYGIPDLDLARSIALSVTDNQSETFKVYPNPVSDYLILESTKLLKRAEILIFNSLGQLILNTHIDSALLRLNLSQFNSGVYLLKVIFNDKIQTIKIIKQ